MKKTTASVLRTIATSGTFLVLFLGGESSAQDLHFKHYKIYDLNSMRSYIKKASKTKKAIKKSKNIPVSYSMMGDKICGFYISRPYGPFDLRGSRNIPLHSTNFITCTEVRSKDDGKIISTEYVYEHLLKEHKPMRFNNPISLASYYRKKENIDFSSFSGPIYWLTFDDRLLLFYRYSEHIKGKTNGFRTTNEFLLIKEYDSNLKLKRKHKIKLGTTRQKVSGKSMAGSVSLYNVNIKKLNEDKLIVMYSVTKYGADDEASYSLVIKKFTKELKLEDEIAIPMPFRLNSSIQPIISNNGDNLYFAVPVVLHIEKEKETFLGKILGSRGKESVRAGLFVFIYTVNLSSGEHDFGILELGNPNKKISSMVFKKSPRDKNSYLIGLIWTFDQKEFSADIIKISINKNNELSLLDKASLKIDVTKHRSSKQINDIYETQNNYLLVVTEMQAIKTTYNTNFGSETYYDFIMKTPILFALHKKQKTTQKFVLLDDISLGYTSYTSIDFHHKSNVRFNIEETIGFIPLDSLSDKALLIFPKLIKVKYTTLIFPSYALSQTNYMVISENNRGEIEVTRSKPLGPSSGNASGFGIRTIRLHNGKITGLFSIDNFVPSIAELEIKD